MIDDSDVIIFYNFSKVLVSKLWTDLLGEISNILQHLYDLHVFFFWSGPAVLVSPSLNQSWSCWSGSPDCWSWPPAHPSGREGGKVGGRQGRTPRLKHYNYNHYCHSNWHIPTTERRQPASSFMRSRHATIASGFPKAPHVRKSSFPLFLSSVSLISSTPVFCLNSFFWLTNLIQL